MLMKCYEISSGQDSNKITRTFQVICTISDGLRKEIVEGELELDIDRNPKGITEEDFLPMVKVETLITKVEVTTIEGGKHI